MDRTKSTLLNVSGSLVMLYYVLFFAGYTNQKLFWGLWVNVEQPPFKDADPVYSPAILVIWTITLLVYVFLNIALRQTDNMPVKVLSAVFAIAAFGINIIAGKAAVISANLASAANGADAVVISALHGSIVSILEVLLIFLAAGLTLMILAAFRPQKQEERNII